MKNPLTILGVIVAVILILVAIEVLLLPDVRKKKAKKKKKIKEDREEFDVTPWKNKIQRLDKKIHELNTKIEKYKSREREYEKKLALEEVKNQKFLEKIKQEKNWQKREHELVEKINKELAGTKEALIKEQEAFSKEHQLKILLDRENKAFQKDHKEAAMRLKNMEKERDGIQRMSDNYRQEVAALKKEIIILKRKKDDVQWVAKSDFDQLKLQARTLQKQIDRLKREHG